MRKIRLLLLIALAISWPLQEIWAASDRPEIIRDAEIEGIIHTLAEPIFNAAGIDNNSVTVVLVKDDSLNAFVAGGMNLFIHTGLPLKTEDANQLIGVLAHETGHMAGGHLIRGEEAMKNASAEAILSTLLGVAAALGTHNSQAGAAVMVGGQEIARRNFLQFSRVQESSADQAALSFLDKAHLSARGLLQFFETLQDQELLPDDKQIEFVLTHPLTRDRIDIVKHHVETSPYSNVPVSPQAQDLLKRMQAKLMGFLKPQLTLQRYSSEDTSTATRYGRAIALYRLGHIPQALDALETLIKEEPQNPFFQELKGQILFENGHVRESIPPYRKAAASLPKSALLHTELGHALIESGDLSLLQEAITHLQESARLEPHNSLTWHLLATAWGQRGRQDLAIYAQAEKALSVGNNDEARNYALRAEKMLPAGSPAWQRTQDILSIVKDSKKKA